MSIFGASEGWSERFKLRMLLGAIVLFFVSAYTSYMEFKFLIFGHRVETTVTSVNSYIHHGRYGSTSEIVEVKYRIAEPGGTQRTESMELSPEAAAEFEAGSPVTVQYLAGSPGDSRIAGHNRIWLTLPFIGCTILLTILSIRFMREYNEHERRMRRG